MRNCSPLGKFFTSSLCHAAFCNFFSSSLELVIFETILKNSPIVRPSLSFLKFAPIGSMEAGPSA
ncbi:hypothetical protein A2964_03055 [Candidatus Daviesbacteria bacterium RIFCSPLOWO2_01_FULL_40_27]|nr:MAG: hypothetical protein A2964_03055 [Candidatus Daviesbacteria bacterium RIFCSPLOWO2_01_FULL_40_27]